MFQPIPMYETNAIQLHFLVWLFWYLSQWSGSICSIFCNRLYSKDIHCGQDAKKKKFNLIFIILMLWAKCMPIDFQFQQGLFCILTNCQT